MKQNSESERRSPSSEDDRDERESRAEIQNAEDYNEIFQPKNSISEAWLPPRQVHVPTYEMEADGPFWGQHPCHSLSLILNSHQARLCPQALETPAEGPKAAPCPARPKPRKAHRGKEGPQAFGADLRLRGVGTGALVCSCGPGNQLPPPASWQGPGSQATPPWRLR